MTWYVYWSAPPTPANSAAADNKEGAPVSVPVIAGTVAGGGIAIIVVIIVIVILLCRRKRQTGKYCLSSGVF